MGSVAHLILWYDMLAQSVVVTCTSACQIHRILTNLMIPCRRTRSSQQDELAKHQSSDSMCDEVCHITLSRQNSFSFRRVENQRKQGCPRKSPSV